MTGGCVRLSGKPELSILSAMGDPDLAGLAVRAGIQAIIPDADHGFVLNGRVSTIVTATREAGGRASSEFRFPDKAKLQLSLIRALHGLDGTTTPEPGRPL